MTSPDIGPEARGAYSPPPADEYAPFYAAYVAGIAGRDPVALLRRQPTILRDAFRDVSDGAASFRYAPGKWSVRQVLGHLSDAERILACRLLCVSRGDTTPLPGFDENVYVDAAGFDRRPLAALLDDFEANRLATVRLVEGIPYPDWSRIGTANGSPVSARALLHILPGHVAHHLRILHDRYGIHATD